MKTPRWKVRKLSDGRWLAHHPGCPPRDHFCWRWLSFQPYCTTRGTLPEAYQQASERYTQDAYEDYRPLKFDYYNPNPPKEPNDQTR